MKRKKILKIGLASAFAFFLALTGCAKANDGAQKPLNIISEEEIKEPIEDNDQEIIKEKVFNQTGELSVKSAPLVYPTATLHFIGAENVRAANNQDVTETLGLTNPPFSVVYSTNSGKYNMYMRTDGIWMYGLAGNSVKGNKITVTMAAGYVIKTINISFIEGYSEAAEVSVGGDVKTGTNGYYLINSDSFTLLANAGASESDLQVRFDSIQIEYELPTTRETIEFGLTTSASLSYEYNKDWDEFVDSLNSESIGVSSYSDWSDKTLNSDVVYSGYTSGSSNKIWLKATDNSGIFTTENPNNYEAMKITVRWHASTSAGRVVQVLGKNTEYESKSDLYSKTASVKGDVICELSFDDKDENNETSFTILSSYKYIGIRSKENTLYLDNIDIQWNSTPTYDYSNAAIRFGNLMEQDLWTDLNGESTIKGYGVMLSTPGYLSGNEIKEWFADNSLGAVEEDDLNAAIATACGENVGAVKNFYTKITGEKTNPVEATAEQKGGLEGDYYIWNLYKGVATADLTTSFTAVAYIRVESGIVFLNETTASVKSLAGDLIDDDTNAYDEDSFEGSLNYLANLA